MNIIRTGESALKSLIFNIFTCIFGHFLHFMKFSYAEQINNVYVFIELNKGC